MEKQVNNKYKDVHVDTNKPGQVLEGIRVLDLSRVLAGAYAGMLLADMGADVIKIERPGTGDDSRSFGPYRNGESYYFMNLNRNKRGITLNLKGEGTGLFLDLVKRSDIVLENFSPGTMDRLGLGYENLKKVNPKIIYGAISGFGYTGPYRKRPGYDLIAQASSGLMSMTGPEGGEPVRAGAPVCDVAAGLSLAVGLLGALHYRDAAGEGQFVDVALYDTAVSTMQTIQTFYINGDYLPTRIGNRYQGNYPNEAFPALDGRVVISVANDHLWRRFCDAINRPELKECAKYAANQDRVKNREEIKALVEEWTMKRTAKDIVDTLEDFGVPAAPINNIAQMMEDEQTKARELFVEVEHPRAGRTKLFGTQLKYSRRPISIRRPAPLLGQHNQEVYGEILGLSPEDICRYGRDHVI